MISILASNVFIGRLGDANQVEVVHREPTHTHEDKECVKRDQEDYDVGFGGFEQPCPPQTAIHIVALRNDERETYRCDITGQDGHGEHKGEEVTVVASTNTSTNPRAMVIKLFNAVVAEFTMLGASWSIYATCCTELDRLSVHIYGLNGLLCRLTRATSWYDSRIRERAQTEVQTNDEKVDAGEKDIQPASAPGQAR